ncbi:hypothetical protein TRVA0_034S01728 [Trichomonascus vanleenenianus]|uniref:uncharacterized protein n=1 Tax=Trichomonascus vanleenenianus TaxID=2268995 RepID=UPI003ECB1F63
MTQQQLEGKVPSRNTSVSSIDTVKTLKAITRRSRRSFNVQTLGRLELDSIDQSPEVRGTMSLDNSCPTSPNVEGPPVASRNRWSMPAQKRPLSVEQDRLQEKLALLARCENARLPDEDLRRHHKRYSLQPFDSDSSFSSMSSIELSSTTSITDFASLDSVLDEPVPSGGPLPSVAQQVPFPASPVSIHRTSSARKRARESLLVMNDNDLLRLENAARTAVLKSEEEGGFVGPSRPGEIGGSILSWRMTTDMIRAIVDSVLSPTAVSELVKFVWVTFSRPENFSGLFSQSEWAILPPTEVVASVRSSIPSNLALKALSRLAMLLRSVVCTGLAFSVIFIQVCLLSMMVIVYVVGDIAIQPAKFISARIAPAKSNPAKKRPHNDLTNSTNDNDESCDQFKPPSRAALKQMHRKASIRRRNRK